MAQTLYGNPYYMHSLKVTHRAPVYVHVQILLLVHELHVHEEVTVLVLYSTFSWDVYVCWGPWDVPVWTTWNSGCTMKMLITHWLLTCIYTASTTCDICTDTVILSNMCLYTRTHFHFFLSRTALLISVIVNQRLGVWWREGGGS